MKLFGDGANAASAHPKRPGARSARRGLRLPALTAVALAALVVGASSGLGATPDTPYSAASIDVPEPQAKARFPERTEDARDLTGDGVSDIFAANYMHDVAGAKDAGRVYLISGADRSVRYQLNSPEIQEGAQFGFYISVPGDLNGDGKDDLVVGAPFFDVGGNLGQGRVYVFSGPTGRLLDTIDSPRPQADSAQVFGGFGARIGRAGDLTGDGVPEIIVGAPGYDVPAGCAEQDPIPAGCRKNEGAAFIFNGANRQLVRELNVPAADKAPESCTTTSDFSRCGNFGGSVQSPGDIDRDGVEDQLVAAYALRPTPDRFGRMYLFSGRTGGALSRIDAPEPDSNQFFGLQEVDALAPGDVNGDGTPDIFGDAFFQDGPAGAGQGKAWVFDGRASVATGSGVVLYELNDPTPKLGEGFGFSMDRTDYNKDGRPDLYLGAVPHRAPGTNSDTHVFNGRDGSLLKTLALPASEEQPGTDANPGNALGFSVRAPGDLNGDAQPDFVAAAPFTDVAGNQDQGKLYAFRSRDVTRPTKPTVRGPRRTSDHTPTYRFSSRDVDNPPSELSFRCSFDSRRLRKCSRRFTKRLRTGRHLLRVQAVDPAGNRSRVVRVRVRITARRIRFTG